MPNDLRLGGAGSDARWVADCLFQTSASRLLPLWCRTLVRPLAFPVLPTARSPDQALPSQQHCRLPAHAATANTMYKHTCGTVCMCPACWHMTAVGSVQHIFQSSCPAYAPQPPCRQQQVIMYSMAGSDHSAAVLLTASAIYLFHRLTASFCLQGALFLLIPHHRLQPCTHASSQQQMRLCCYKVPTPIPLTAWAVTLCASTLCAPLLQGWPHHAAADGPQHGRQVHPAARSLPGSGAGAVWVPRARQAVHTDPGGLHLHASRGPGPHHVGGIDVHGGVRGDKLYSAGVLKARHCE